MLKIIQKISISASLIISSTYAMAESVPHWVEVGSTKQSVFSINTVIDPTAEYPKDRSNTLREVLKKPQNKVETISRSIAMDCEYGRYMVVAAGLIDKNGDFLETESEEFVNNDDISQLPKSVQEKMNVVLCKK